MPAERRPLCRACNSPHREEIEGRLLAGESSRNVSAWLKRERGESISHNGLAAHKAGHIRVAAEARAEVQARAERAKAAGVLRRVADIDMLDAFARLAFKTARELAPLMKTPSMAQSTAYAAVLREGREMVKLRDELLRDPNDAAPSAPLIFKVDCSYPERPTPIECQSPPPAESSSHGNSDPPLDAPRHG